MFMKYVIANTRICIALVMWHLALSYDNDSTGIVQHSCPCEYSDKKQFFSDIIVTLSRQFTQSLSMRISDVKKVLKKAQIEYKGILMPSYTYTFVE